MNSLFSFLIGINIREPQPDLYMLVFGLVSFVFSIPFGAFFDCREILSDDNPFNPLLEWLLNTFHPNVSETPENVYLKPLFYIQLVITIYSLVVFHILYQFRRRHFFSNRQSYVFEFYCNACALSFMYCSSSSFFYSLIQLLNCSVSPWPLILLFLFSLIPIPIAVFSIFSVLTRPFVNGCPLLASSPRQGILLAVLTATYFCLETSITVFPKSIGRLWVSLGCFIMSLLLIVITFYRVTFFHLFARIGCEISCLILFYGSMFAGIRQFYNKTAMFYLEFGLIIVSSGVALVHEFHATNRSKEIMQHQDMVLKLLTTKNAENYIFNTLTRSSFFKLINHYGDHSSTYIGQNSFPNDLVYLFEQYYSSSPELLILANRLAFQFGNDFTKSFDCSARLLENQMNSYLSSIQLLLLIQLCSEYIPSLGQRSISFQERLYKSLTFQCISTHQAFWKASIRSDAEIIYNAALQLHNALFLAEQYFQISDFSYYPNNNIFTHFLNFQLLINSQYDVLLDSNNSFSGLTEQLENQVYSYQKNALEDVELQALIQTGSSFITKKLQKKIDLYYSLNESSDDFSSLSQHKNKRHSSYYKSCDFEQFKSIGINLNDETPTAPSDNDKKTENNQNNDTPSNNGANKKENSNYPHRTNSANNIDFNKTNNSTPNITFTHNSNSTNNITFTNNSNSTSNITFTNMPTKVEEESSSGRSGYDEEDLNEDLPIEKDSDSGNDSDSDSDIDSDDYQRKNNNNTNIKTPKPIKINEPDKRNTTIENKTSSIENNTSPLDNKTSNIENKASAIENNISTIENNSSSIENYNNTIENNSSSIENYNNSILNTTPDTNNTNHDLNNITLDTNNTNHDLNNITIDANDPNHDMNTFTIDTNDANHDINNTTHDKYDGSKDDLDNSDKDEKKEHQRGHVRISQSNLVTPSEKNTNLIKPIFSNENNHGILNINSSLTLMDFDELPAYPANEKPEKQVSINSFFKYKPEVRFNCHNNVYAHEIITKITPDLIEKYTFKRKEPFNFKHYFVNIFGHLIIGSGFLLIFITMLVTSLPKVIICRNTMSRIKRNIFTSMVIWNLTSSVNLFVSSGQVRYPSMVNETTYPDLIETLNLSRKLISATKSDFSEYINYVFYNNRSYLIESLIESKNNFSFAFDADLTIDYYTLDMRFFNLTKQVGQKIFDMIQKETDQIRIFFFTFLGLIGFYFLVSIFLFIWVAGHQQEGTKEFIHRVLSIDRTQLASIFNTFTSMKKSLAIKGHSDDVIEDDEFFSGRSVFNDSSFIQFRAFLIIVCFTIIDFAYAFLVNYYFSYSYIISKECVDAGNLYGTYATSNEILLLFDGFAVKGLRFYDFIIKAFQLYEQTVYINEWHQFELSDNISLIQEYASQIDSILERLDVTKYICADFDSNVFFATSLASLPNTSLRESIQSIVKTQYTYIGLCLMSIFSILGKPNYFPFRTLLNGAKTFRSWSFQILDFYNQKNIQSLLLVLLAVFLLTFLVFLCCDLLYQEAYQIFHFCQTFERMFLLLPKNSPFWDSEHHCINYTLPPLTSDSSLIIEAMPFGAVYVDSSNRILRYNKACANVFKNKASYINSNYLPADIRTNLLKNSVISQHTSVESSANMSVSLIPELEMNVDEGKIELNKIITKILDLHKNDPISYRICYKKQYPFVPGDDFKEFHAVYLIFNESNLFKQKHEIHYLQDQCKLFRETIVPSSLLQVTFYSDSPNIILDQFSTIEIILPQTIDFQTFHIFQNAIRSIVISHHQAYFSFSCMI